jgi:Fic family protein
MPILFERPTYEWVARVNQKQKQLAELLLSLEEKQTLDRWTEIEFVYSTLKLEGLDVQRDTVERLASSQAAPDDSVEGKLASALFESLRTVASMAREQGKDSALSVELLLKINNATGAQLLRGAADATSKVTAENLPLVLESACQWFSADSFAELHPIEQASIVFLRLIELRPFDQGNQQTALVAASLFTLRSGLPPIIIDPESQPAHRAALNEGIRMNTKPMVELVAESVEKSLRQMILQAK